MPPAMPTHCALRVFVLQAAGINVLATGGDTIEMIWLQNRNQTAAAAAIITLSQHRAMPQLSRVAAMDNQARRASVGEPAV